MPCSIDASNRYSQSTARPHRHSTPARRTARGTNGFITSSFANGENRWLATPPNGMNAPFKADQQPRRDSSVEAHPRQDRSTRGMTDRDLRPHVELAKQRADIRRHARQRQPMRRRRLREAMSGQIRRDHREMLRQQRQQARATNGSRRRCRESEAAAAPRPSAAHASEFRRPRRSCWHPGWASPRHPCSRRDRTSASALCRRRRRHAGKERIIGRDEFVLGLEVRHRAGLETPRWSSWRGLRPASCWCSRQNRRGRRGSSTPARSANDRSG